MRKLAQGVSFVTWNVILNRIVHNYGMMWQTSSVKASKACLLSEAEARRKEKSQELATKKMGAVMEEIYETEPVTAVEDFKFDHKAAARDALYRVQQELVTEEIKQKVKLELENEKTQ